MKSSDTSNLDKQICENCHGSGEDSQVIFGEQPTFVNLFRNKIPVIGSVSVKVCTVCKGTGYVPKDAGPASGRAYVKEMWDAVKGDSPQISHTDSDPLLSQEEVHGLIHQAVPDGSLNQGLDPEEVCEVELPVIALPISQDYQVEGDPFAALATQLSLKGIRIYHDDPIESKFLLLELVTSRSETMDLLARVVCRLRIGHTCDTWCEFVTQ